MLQNSWEFGKKQVFPKMQSNIKADSNPEVPSWEMKNANLEANDNPTSCAKTLKCQEIVRSLEGRDESI